MNRPDYHADLRATGEGLAGITWKLERSQVFYEEGDSAWEAFLAGDWQRVLDIFEGERTDVRAAVEREAARGYEFRRLRIVEHPPGPYLRWEMHSHKVFAECGRPIRVLDAGKVSDLEADGQLPELLVLGDRALYNVRYDDVWTPRGAKRIDDPEAVREAAEAIAKLYERGEPLLEYFEREIAPLGPPRHEG